MHEPIGKPRRPRQMHWAKPGRRGFHTLEYKRVRKERSLRSWELIAGPENIDLLGKMPSNLLKTAIALNNERAVSDASAKKFFEDKSGRIFARNLLWHHPKESKREAAAAFLGVTNSPRAAELLSKALWTEPSDKVCAVIGRAMANINCGTSAVALGKIANSNFERSFRRSAVTALGYHGREAIPVLKRVLDHYDPLIRQDVVQSLGRINSKTGASEVIPILEKAVSDSFEAVSNLALDELSAIKARQK